MRQGLSVVARTATVPRSRETVRRNALHLMDNMRRFLADMVQACERRPEPRDLVRDVTRGRNATDETIFAAIIAAALDAPLDAIDDFCLKFRAELYALKGVHPSSCVVTALRLETQHQADADVVQMQIPEAVRTKDRALLQRILEKTERHAQSAHDLASRVRAHLQSMRPTLYRVVSPS